MYFTLFVRDNSDKSPQSVVDCGSVREIGTYITVYNHRISIRYKLLDCNCAIILPYLDGMTPTIRSAMLASYTTRKINRSYFF